MLDINNVCQGVKIQQAYQTNFNGLSFWTTALIPMINTIKVPLKSSATNEYFQPNIVFVLKDH